MLPTSWSISGPVESGSDTGLVIPKLDTLKAVSETCGPFSPTLVAVRETSDPLSQLGGEEQEVR